jgi:hypothetical protein
MVAHHVGDRLFVSRLPTDPIAGVFSLEYAKDLHIIVIKKKNLTVQTTRFR